MLSDKHEKQPGIMQWSTMSVSGLRYDRNSRSTLAGLELSRRAVTLAGGLQDSWSHQHNQHLGIKIILRHSLIVRAQVSHGRPTVFLPVTKRSLGE